MYNKKISGSIKKGENLCSCYRLVKRGRLQSLWLLGVHQKRQTIVVQALCWWLFELFKLYKMKWWHWDQCSTLVWEPGALLGQQVLSPTNGEDAERWMTRKKEVSASSPQSQLCRLLQSFPWISIS